MSRGRAEIRRSCGDALDEALKLQAGSIDAIVTDPPYAVEHLDCYDKLAKLADHLLPDGGNCLVMTGQANLLSVGEALTERLKYQWTLCYYTPGASTQVFGRHVKSNWKPILWLTKGGNENEHVDDLITSDASDKRFHEWGQSVTGMSRVVERFTNPGSLVCDPFCGAGTTGIAALALDRKFLGMDTNLDALNNAADRLGEVG